MKKQSYSSLQLAFFFFLPSSCTEKLILIVVISFDVTFPRAISANGWSVSLPKEGKAADDDNYKDCWLFLFICV